MKSYLYYILMTEPRTQHNISVDTCQHKLIYDQEWVCCLCGRVFSEEEAEELQRGSTEVTAVKDLNAIGLDPHGRTPLWLQGLGTVECYQQLQKHGDRDDISIISNIVSKLELPSYIAVEFLQLYRSFLKDKKEDRIPATKLSLLLLTTRYPLLRERLKKTLSYMHNRSVTDQEVVEYIFAVIEGNFNANKNKKEDRHLLIMKKGLLQRIAHIAIVRGAKYACNYSKEMI